MVGGGGPPTKGGVSGEVRGNVFCGWRDIGSQQRGIGMEVGNVRKAVVDGNLIAHGGRPYPLLHLRRSRPRQLSRFYRRRL